MPMLGLAPGAGLPPPPMAPAPAVPPSAPAKPLQEQGRQMRARLQVVLATKVLKEALPSLAPGSDEEKAVLKALAALSTVAPEPPEPRLLESELTALKPGAAPGPAAPGGGLSTPPPGIAPPMPSPGMVGGPAGI